MTWMGEVAHVAWKDVRQQRWLVLAYVALVVIATLRAVLLAQARPVSGALNLFMPLVVILGCFLAAIVMQTDSPARADAFWVTRPFHGSAVLVAKIVVVAAIVVGIALVGEAIGLSAFDISLARIAWMLFACFATFGLWLLLSMLLGAATRDLRSSIVGFIAVVISTVTLAGLLANRFSPLFFRPWVRSLFYVVAIGGALTTLVGLYVRRGRSLHAWAAASLMMGCALATASVPPSRPRHQATSRTAGPIKVAIDAPNTIIQSGRLALRFSAPAAPDSLATHFTVSGVTVYLRDGTAVPLQYGVPVVQLRGADIPIASGTQWLVRGGFLAVPKDGFDLELSGREMSLLSRGFNEVEVRGVVSLDRPRVMATLPLVAGAQVRAAGRETHIVSINGTARGMLLDVTTVALQSDEANTRLAAFMTAPGVSFALLNEQRRQAISLQSISSGGGSDWLVLPGTSLDQRTLRLQTLLNRVPRDSLNVQSDWYRGARLLVAEWDTENEYPVTLRATPD